MILSKLLKCILGITVYIWVFFFLTMKSPVLGFFLQLPYSFCLYSSTWHLAVLLDTVSMFQCWLFKKNVGTFFRYGSLWICVFFSCSQSVGSEKRVSVTSIPFVLNHRQNHTWELTFGMSYALFVSVMWLWMPWGSLGKPVTRPRVVSQWWSCCLENSEGGERCMWGLFLDTHC